MYIVTIVFTSLENKFLAFHALPIIIFVVLGSIVYCFLGKKMGATNSQLIEYVLDMVTILATLFAIAGLFTIFTSEYYSYWSISMNNSYSRPSEPILMLKGDPLLCIIYTIIVAIALHIRYGIRKVMTNIITVLLFISSPFMVLLVLYFRKNIINTWSYFKLVVMPSVKYCVDIINSKLSFIYINLYITDQYHMEITISLLIISMFAFILLVFELRVWGFILSIYVGMKAIPQGMRTFELDKATFRWVQRHRKTFSRARWAWVMVAFAYTVSLSGNNIYTYWLNQPFFLYPELGHSNFYVIMLVSTIFIAHAVTACGVIISLYNDYLIQILLLPFYPKIKLHESLQEERVKLSTLAAERYANIGFYLLGFRIGEAIFLFTSILFYYVRNFIMIGLFLMLLTLILHFPESRFYLDSNISNFFMLKHFIEHYPRSYGGVIGYLIGMDFIQELLPGPAGFFERWFYLLAETALIFSVPFFAVKGIISS